MTWYYKGIELVDENIPETAFGFVYLITYKPNGRQYIGRKIFTKAHRRQKNKKIIRSRVESDWRDYWSSSPEINRMIEEEGGTSNFTREVLVFADCKSRLNYLEEKFLYSLDTMESEHFFNSNIRSKVYKRNILNKLDVTEINSVLETLKKGLA